MFRMLCRITQSSDAHRTESVSCDSVTVCYSYDSTHMELAWLRIVSPWTEAAAHHAPLLYTPLRWHRHDARVPSPFSSPSSLGFPSSPRGQAGLDQYGAGTSRHASRRRCMLAGLMTAERGAHTAQRRAGPDIAYAGSHRLATSSSSSRLGADGP